MCPLAFSAGGGDPDGPGPGGGVGEPACGGKGGGREEEEEDEEEEEEEDEDEDEEEDEDEDEEEDEEEERHHSPVPVCACGPGNRRRPGLAPKRGSVTRSGACVLCRGPADRTGRGKDGASRTEHCSPVVETGVCPTGRGFGSRCDVRKQWPLKRAHAGAAAVQREISSGSSCPSRPSKKATDRQVAPDSQPTVQRAGRGIEAPRGTSRDSLPDGGAPILGRSFSAPQPGRAVRAAGGPGGWSTRQGPRHRAGPAADSRGVRSGRPAGRAAGRPGRAPATAPARRQRAGACVPGGRPAGRLVDPEGPPPPPGPGGREPGRPAGRPAPPGKKGRAQGPRRRPRAVLPLPAGRDGTEGRDTRADARVGGDWLAPPAPRPRASPPGEGTAGPPCDGPGLPSAPRLSPRPPAQPAGEDPRRGSGGRGAAPRGREAPPGAAPLLSSPPTSAPARSAEDGGPPPPPTGARGRGHAAARPRRGGAPAEGRERERAGRPPFRPRPGSRDGGLSAPDPGPDARRGRAAPRPPRGGERGRRPAGGDGGGPAIRGRPRLPRRCRIVPPGRDSDLEAFSHNPTDGSFAPLAPQPSTYTKCLNLRFLSY
ncbi:hypothetical protein ABFV05_000821 [Capra hircus]